MEASEESSPLMSIARDNYQSLKNAERGVEVIDIDVSNTKNTKAGEKEQPEEKKQGTLVIVFALWSSMMGTSLLSMPWAFQQAGLVQGIVLLMLVAGLSTYTGVLVLSASNHYVDPLTGYIPEFAEVCQQLLGKFGTIITTQCSVIVFVGTLIVYWILMSELLYNSVNSMQYFFGGISALNASQSNKTMLDNSSANWFSTHSNVTIVTTNSTCPDEQSNSIFSIPPNPAWTENRTVPLFLIIIFAPLIQLKSPSFFTKFGAVGCLPVILLVIYCAIKSSIWGLNADFVDESSVHHAQLIGDNFPALSGILTMAFYMHNGLVTFFKRSKTPENNIRDLTLSFMLVLLTYMVIGVGIMLSFPDNKDCLKQNFFGNIPLTDPMSLVTQILLFFRLVTLFPLMSYILRVQIFVPLRGSEYPSHLSVGLLNVITIGLCIFCAMFFPNIGDIIRYAGAACGMIYMFILPCFIDTIIHQRKPECTRQKSRIWRHSFHIFISVFAVANFLSQFAVKE